MQRLNLRPEDVFYDLGSGYGRLIFYAALATPVGKAKGVELVGERVQRCYATQKMLGEEDRRLEFINKNVKEVDYSDGTVFFLFNPFTPETLEYVTNQLKAIADKKTIRIVSYGLSCSYLDRQGEWLRPVEEFHWGRIYESFLPSCQSNGGENKKIEVRRTGATNIEKVRQAERHGGINLGAEAMNLQVVPQTAMNTNVCIDNNVVTAQGDLSLPLSKGLSYSVEVAKIIRTIDDIFRKK